MFSAIQKDITNKIDNKNSIAKKTENRIKVYSIHVCFKKVMINFNNLKVFFKIIFRWNIYDIISV